MQFFPGGKYNVSFICFIISSTLVSYNFHWFLTRPKQGTSVRGDWTLKHRGVLLAMLLIGIAGSIIFFIPLMKHWLPIAAIVFITFIYSAPKIPVFSQLNKIAVAKTLFLTTVWVYVTTVLYFLVSEIPYTNEQFLFCLSRFFLIYCICILFDYRDHEDDRKNGLNSLPVNVNGTTLAIFFYGSALLFMIVTASLYFKGFSGTAVMMMLIPGVIVALLYDYARNHFSDYLYYFVLDGMMMFSSLLTLLISF